MQDIFEAWREEEEAQRQARLRRSAEKADKGADGRAAKPDSAGKKTGGNAGGAGSADKIAAGLTTKKSTVGQFDPTNVFGMSNPGWSKQDFEDFRVAFTGDREEDSAQTAGRANGKTFGSATRLPTGGVGRTADNTSMQSAYNAAFGIPTEAMAAKLPPKLSTSGVGRTIDNEAMRSAYDAAFGITDPTMMLMLVDGKLRAMPRSLFGDQTDTDLQKDSRNTTTSKQDNTAIVEAIGNGTLPQFDKNNSFNQKKSVNTGVNAETNGTIQRKYDGEILPALPKDPIAQAAEKYGEEAVNEFFLKPRPIYDWDELGLFETQCYYDNMLYHEKTKEIDDELAKLRAIRAIPSIVTTAIENFDKIRDAAAAAGQGNYLGALMALFDPNSIGGPSLSDLPIQEIWDKQLNLNVKEWPIDEKREFLEHNPMKFLLSKANQKTRDKLAEELFEYATEFEKNGVTYSNDQDENQRFNQGVADYIRYIARLNMEYEKSYKDFQDSWNVIGKGIYED